MIVLQRFLFLLALCLLPASLVAFEANLPIVISGGGPAALMFAHRFLRLNQDSKHQTSIWIYEKRDRPQRYIDSQNLDVAGDYAFGFGLGMKAQNLLKKIPGLLEAVEAISQPTAFAPGIDIRMVNRRELCAEMLYELEKEFGNDERLKLHFGTSVMDLDANDQVVTVMDRTTNVTQQFPYSILIAADGINSQIRSELVESGDLECEEYYNDVTWKALQLPAQPNLDPHAFQRYPRMFYKPHKSIKRDNGALVPRFHNRFFLLNFRQAQYNANDECPFDAKTPSELRQAISVALPDVVNFPDDSVPQAFIDRPAGKEKYMKLDRHVVEDRKIALMGDASVGMYSLFGQGCASALWQADLLAESLTNHTTTDVTMALSLYSNTSVVEGHAITDLNLLRHSLTRRFPIKFWALLQMMSIGKALLIPKSYREILDKKKLAIWFSKRTWRKERLPVVPTTLQEE